MQNRSLQIRFWLLPVFICLALSSCTVKVNKSGEDDNGRNKNVDIQTPVGSIHVRNDADAQDIGIPVYPGARRKERNEGGDQKSANVNLSFGAYGVKVMAVEYLTDDSPDKVAAYYKDQLKKKFGAVLECHTSHRGHDMGEHDDGKGSDALKCEGDNSGKVVELKSGTRNNQHLVSIQPVENGKGSDFGLVYIRLRGKDTI
jgi:hypothetical protein